MGTTISEGGDIIDEVNEGVVLTGRFYKILFEQKRSAKRNKSGNIEL